MEFSFTEGQIQGERCIIQQSRAQQQGSISCQRNHSQSETERLEQSMPMV